MAICQFCQREMTTAVGCTVDVLHRRGRPHPMIPSSPGRCGDCGAHPGGQHHRGCDSQWCPACGGQLFLCDCTWDEDPGGVDPDDDWDDDAGDDPDGGVLASI